MISRILFSGLQDFEDGDGREGGDLLAGVGGVEDGDVGDEEVLALDLYPEFGHGHGCSTGIVSF